MKKRLHAAKMFNKKYGNMEYMKTKSKCVNNAWNFVKLVACWSACAINLQLIILRAHRHTTHTYTELKINYKSPLRYAKYSHKSILQTCVCVLACKAVKINFVQLSKILNCNIILFINS